MRANGNGAIKITGVVTEEVGEPRNDGTPGSGLYAVPFRLSHAPSVIWVKAFEQAWNMPPRFTSMHRPGIAKVTNDRIILDGTTMEEVERFHLDTLKLAVAEANRITEREEEALQKQAGGREQKREDHRKKVQDIANRLRF
jgi:hypothetical protein